MSSRRTTNHHNRGVYHNQRNGSRNPPAKDGRGQQHGHPTRPTAVSFEGNNSRRESYSVQLLRRIFEDKDDTSFAKRVADINELLELLKNARTAHSDSLEFRQEQMQLLDLCIHEEGIQRIVEFTKAPPSLKSALLKVVSGLACYTRLDLALSWIFDRLSVWQTLENNNSTASTNISNKSKEVEWKKWLLRLLKQIFADSSADRYTYKQLTEMSPVVLTSIITFLDAMDSPEYLPLVVDLLTYFSNNHPNLFSEKFKDIIDLLVGWNLDPQLSETERALITGSYTNFAHHWNGRMSFAIELLTYFLNDMQSIIQELKASQGQDESLTNWNACKNLLSCFKSILDILLPQFAANGEGSVNPQLVDIALTNLLSGMLSLLYAAQDLEPEAAWLQTSKEIMFSLVSIRTPVHRSIQYQLFSCLFTSPKLSFFGRDEQAYLGALLKFLKLWNHDIDENIVYRLLNFETSQILQLKTQYNNTKHLEQLLLAILRFLMRTSLSEMTQQQLASKYISELQKKLARFSETVGIEGERMASDLFTKTGSLVKLADFMNTSKDEACNIERSDGLAKHQGTIEQAVKDILFLHYILLDMAVVWPNVRQNISLTLVGFFCNTYKNGWIRLYIPCFRLLMDFWSSQRMSFTLAEENGTHIMLSLFEDFVKMDWSEVHVYIRRSVCQSIQSMLIILKEDTSLQKLNHSAFDPVLDGLCKVAETETNTEMKAQILATLSYYFQNFGSTRGSESVLKTIEHSISVPDQKSREACIDLLCSLNPFILLSVYDADDRRANSIQRIIMATPHTGSFRPVHYEIVAKHLGMSRYLVSPDDKQHQKIKMMDRKNGKRHDSEWIRRLFHHCGTIETLQSIISSMPFRVEQYKIGEMLSNNDQLLSYWVLWESARYCILSRLRTPFGGPQQTFAAFEDMLQSLVDGTKQNDEEKLIRLRELLLFLDRLELQISNAVDGCATGVLPTVTKSSLIFFRTNRKTCKDYFSRIRPNIIAGAKLTSNNHFLIYHTTKLLRELEYKLLTFDSYIQIFEEINNYLRDLVEACIAEKYSDYIYGLQSWFKNLIKKAYQEIPGLKDNWSFERLIGPQVETEAVDGTKANSSWFQVAALFASGHDEMAIKLLSTLIQRYKSNDHCGLLKMLTKKSMEYYTSLENYGALQETIMGPATTDSTLNKFLGEAISQFCKTNDTSNAADHTDYQAALTKFEVFMKSSPTLQDITQFTNLDKLKQCVFDINSSAAEDIASLLCDRIISVFANDFASNELPTSILNLQVLKVDNIANKLKQNAQEWMSSELSEIENLSMRYNTKEWSRVCSAFKNVCISQRQPQTSIEEDDLLATHSWGYMQLFTAIIARKQGNIKLADYLIKESINVPVTKYQSMLEQSKIFFAQSNYVKAMKDANLVLCHAQATPGCDELRKKTLLEIASFLKYCVQQEADIVDDMLLELTSIESSIKEKRAKANELMSAVDLTIEYALSQSIIDNEHEGKPWFEYATYHYKQAWRILDDLSKKDCSTTAAVGWARKKLKAILSNYGEFHESKLSQAISNAFDILIKHTSYIREQEDPLTNSLVRNELQDAFPNCTQAVEDVMAVLKAVQSPIMSHFHASTVAYFRYLTVATSKQKDATNELTSMSITAALRLIRILIKYGEALGSVFEDNVETGRIKLWKLVIPQLFAQLNHHSSFVRSIVTKIILRICEEYPSEIIYDVIVNSVSVKTKNSTKQCLNAIAGRVMRNSQVLWASTSRMVEELEKITVLIEEKWMNKIASMQNEVMQQYSILEAEIRKLKEDGIDDIASASAADYQESTIWALYHSIMEPLVSTMDGFFADTKTEGALMTPHEKWFWNTYGAPLTHAQKLLKNPDSLNEYRKGWEIYQQVYRQIMVDTGKVRVLELNQISPYLFNMTNTLIRMPGLSQNIDIEKGCFLSSFDSIVIVLPTKTKPKKLSLNGTDGQKYPYLFKGLEDLHLDERVMQLLTTTNGLLKENRTTALRGMRSRTYAVIPISDHSGMIQWVNDSTPLFSLYKKWQKREMTAYNLMKNDDDNSKNDAVLRVLQQRPTEHFLSKVAAVLKAFGLKVSANRRHWPLEVLKKVHLDLVKETPGHLLESELYYSSSNATEWVKKAASFARSLAVTSIIGYIIGLGDRHLDNILIDFQSGELIHIDYNVCFEKGLLLRVPELVPYRLTQNLYKALGIAGTEGQFKTAAEETLRVLRKHKEVLITLLDAFVYDPLVDWENEVAGGTGKQRMADLQANVTALASRIIEKEDEYATLSTFINVAIEGLISKLFQWQESKLLEAETIAVDDVVYEEYDNKDDTHVEKKVHEQPDESDVYQGRLPFYLLRETKKQLQSVYELVRLAKSPTKGIVPLLESVTIIETEADNEMRPAQNYAKQALDNLGKIVNELQELDKQLKNVTDYESEWTYGQIMDIIASVKTSVEQYFMAAKAIEEFGPDNTRIGSTAQIEPNASSFKLEHSTPPLEKSKSTSNKHAMKIMRRIRAKLDGIDFGVKHRMGVSEQVARTIEQATSIENLSLMYEGWTSWV